MNDSDTIRQASERLIEAQRSVRILESVRWTDEVRVGFFNTGAAELPKVDADWYRRRDLGFDCVKKTGEFEEIARGVERTLGAPQNAVRRRLNFPLSRIE